MDSITQIAAIAIALAVTRRNFDEGKAIAQNSGFFKNFMWGFVALFDDLTAAGLIIGLLRLTSGGTIVNVLWVAPWLATTFLILRSTGHINWGQFTSKL
ncbi:MAG TPA: hypothetical protein PK833_03455, partial [Vicingus sp.]|nr:hypothetical protein [Vicingus sp.]